MHLSDSEKRDEMFKTSKSQFPQKSALGRSFSNKTLKMETDISFLLIVSEFNSIVNAKFALRAFDFLNPGWPDMPWWHCSILEAKYDIKEQQKLKEVTEQLVPFFPLICVQTEKAIVLIDFTELVFQPNLFCNLCTWTVKMRITKLMHQKTPMKRHSASCFTANLAKNLYRRSILSCFTIMKSVKIHGFATRVHRRSGTSTSISWCGAC